MFNVELAIETTELKKYFNDIHAVDGLNLKIQKGSLYGILGPNGAGKSTTIRMLSTVLHPTSGHAKILGFDLKKDAHEIKKFSAISKSLSSILTILYRSK